MWFCCVCQWFWSSIEIHEFFRKFKVKLRQSMWRNSIIICGRSRAIHFLVVLRFQGANNSLMFLWGSTWILFDDTLRPQISTCRCRCLISSFNSNYWFATINTSRTHLLVWFLYTLCWAVFQIMSCFSNISPRLVIENSSPIHRPLWTSFMLSLYCSDWLMNVDKEVACHMVST
jgi:hypothetical protein